LPQGWTQEKTIVWQNGIHPAHSWVETVIGATGNVDHNYFFGTLERLKEILKFPTTPPPSGDCNCEEEFAEVYAEIARVEAEMNNNKLQIYNLQQSLQGVADEVSKLYNNDLDKEERLSALEQLVSEIEAIFTE
jgi:hypothetical protein